jgi:hypothetical protein
MQQILNVLDPVANIDFMTLAEAKLMLNIPTTSTTYDAAIQMFITNMSDTVAEMANRAFVKEKVLESFYAINNNEKRIYFSRWPVKLTDIESMTDADGNDLMVAPDWVLEEKTGTLYKPPSSTTWGGTWNGASSGMWSGDVNITYSGGYVLPQETPPALKQLAGAMIREAYYEMLRGALLSGVRMISHKHARVMYYPTGAQAATTGRVASPATQRALQDVLYHYTRWWV